MILEIVFGVLGALIGFVVSKHTHDEALNQQYRKTVEQVDADMRRELEINRNLVESLRADVAHYRRLYNESKQ